MAAWTWAAARCRGTSHVQTGTRCQDAFASTSTPDGALVAVLCDGAGSAELGGQGASIVARLISVRARLHLKCTSNFPDDETIWSWIDEARDAISHAGKLRDRRSRDFAATLLCVLSNGAQTLVVHVGDGCAVAKTSRLEEWIPLTWPAHGEYASSTYFVTDDPAPKAVITRHVEPVSAIVAFTDGIERLALDFAKEMPHSPFFEAIAAPVIRSSELGRDRQLSSQLAAYLDSEKVNERTDDDKTILIAAFR